MRMIQGSRTSIEKLALCIVMSTDEEIGRQFVRLLRFWLETVETEDLIQHGMEC